MKTSTLVWVVVVLIIIAGLIWYVMQAPQPTTQETGPGPTATSTQATSTVPGGTSQAGAPQINTISPQTGKAQIRVTVVGTGFDPNDNAIAFGTATGRHHPDGSPDNVIVHASSTNGTTLSFIVPASGPGGILCDSANHCVAVAAKRRDPGAYDVVVINANGSSNAVPFTMTR